jgi:hypothetical protein
LKLRQQRTGVIGVKVDEGAEEYPQLSGGEHRRGVLKDAVEGGFTGFQYLGSAVALGLDLRLLTLELLFAFLLLALPLFLMLRSALLEFALTFGGFLLRLGFRRGCDGRSGVGGCFGCGLRVMHGAMLVRANCQLAAKLLAVDDDGCLGASHGIRGSASGLSITASISRTWPRWTAPGRCSLGLRQPFSIWTRPGWAAISRSRNASTLLW